METSFKAWSLEVPPSFLKTGSFAAFLGLRGLGEIEGDCRTRTRHRPTTGAKTHPFVVDVVCEKAVSVANREQAAAHRREGAAAPRARVCACVLVCVRVCV